MGEGAGESQGPRHLLAQKQTTMSIVEQMRGIRQLAPRAPGGQDQSSPETTGCPGPKGEGSREDFGRDDNSIPAEMEHGLVTIYDNRQQPTGLAPDLIWSSLPSATDPLL